MQKLSCLLGQVQLLKGHEVCNLAEPVTIVSMTKFPSGKAGDEVQGNVRPWTAGNGQRLEQSQWGLVGGLVLATGDASADVAPDVLLQGRPPKSFLQ